MRAPQTIVFSVFHISRCSPPSVRKNKRGDIWVAVGCEVEHQTPPRAPGVSRGEGRHDVSAGITSSFFFLPAPSEAKVSGQISLYNRQDEKQQPPSDLVRSASDTMGAIHAWCFHQWSCHFKIPEFIGRWNVILPLRVEGGMKYGWAGRDEPRVRRGSTICQEVWLAENPGSESRGGGMSRRGFIVPPVRGRGWHTGIGWDETLDLSLNQS